MSCFMPRREVLLEEDGLHLNEAQGEPVAVVLREAVEDALRQGAAGAKAAHQHGLQAQGPEALSEALWDPFPVSFA